MNVGNKITQKPHSSWVSFYPIIQLFFRCGIPYFCKKTVLFYKHGISNALSIQINGKAAVWLVDDHRGHIWL